MSGHVKQIIIYIAAGGLFSAAGVWQSFEGFYFVGVMFFFLAVAFFLADRLEKKLNIKRLHTVNVEKG